MPTASEPEQIEKAVNGDLHAFRSLVEKYQRFALSLAYRFVGSVDDAEDITQEAFVRLWTHLSKYRPEIKLTTWLYKIITNLCLDFLKSKQSKNRHRMENIYDHAGISEPTTADHLLMSEELKSGILKLAEVLTPKQKAVFLLRDVEGLSVEEVTETLSMSAGNVKSNLYYARLKMSELINLYYQEKKNL
jgi:RNA polymerase sigma-70 factor, ECF subfamily